MTSPRRLPSSLLFLSLQLAGLSGCGLVANATKSGMKPILTHSIEGFVNEPDLELAEGSMLANLKLIEGIVATYPDDRELVIMASMARANFAFAFLQDELEAARLAAPSDKALAQSLLRRVEGCFVAGRLHAERALAHNGDFADLVAGRRLEEIPPAELGAALQVLEKEDAEPLFWLAFNWGGRLQVMLDPAEATQLPKIEAMIDRVLALDDRVFYEVGPHMMAGVLFGFRSAALGGDPKRAEEHFDKARELGDVLLPDVLKAQFVYAQTENEEGFVRTLNEVIAATPRPDRALFDALAKRKACRLLANVDQFFLTDPKPVPELCLDIPQKLPLRAEPIEGSTASEPGTGTRELHVQR